MMSEEDPEKKTLSFRFRLLLFWMLTKRWVYIQWHRIKFFSLALYNRLKLYEISFFFQFLFYRYSAKQFSPLHLPHNIRMLVRIRPYEGLTSTRSGKLEILTTRWQRSFFALKNFLLANALQRRVEMVVYYTYATVTLELNNPFTKKILLKFLDQKIAFLNRLLEYVKRINGKLWDQSLIRVHMDVFYHNSLLQAEVIKSVQLAVKRQKEPAIVKEAKEALKRGLYPILASVGISGSYWMRGVNRQILGLFKPYDEEIQAPNNPVGPRFQGSLGLRKTRRGCRVGESAHHEVGAFLVDEFFGFGIVPKTYYAEFTHSTFYSSRENRFATRLVEKTKQGSFQEYVSGFVSVNKLTREEVESIPLDEFQLVVVLDVILGNTDRNAGNILFGDEKIAAIDHGLCFPDRIDEFSYWYWTYFEQGQKPLFKPIVDLLNHFPFEELANKLQKRCFLSDNVIQRMRERVALFAAAVNTGLVPAQMEQLMHPRFLYPLKDYKETLKEKAAAQVELYREEYL